MALVSRVEGTYEFEVQPLREYFAARYLYETAPYSPPGREKRGTKPDRFDAIASNFYWLNVTRFFSGSFSKGELAGLKERLEELLRKKGYDRSQHPRALIAMLLADWVFAQNPRVTSEVVKLLVDDLGIMYLARQNLSGLHGRSIELPAECGRTALVSRCLEVIAQHPLREFTNALAKVISANTSTAECIAIWMDRSRKETGEQRTSWFTYGESMGALAQAPVESIREILSEGDRFEPTRADALIESGRLDVWDDSEEDQKRALSLVLDNVDFYFCSHVRSYLDLLAIVTDPRRVKLRLDGFGISDATYLDNKWFLYDEQYPLSFVPETAVERHCLDVIKVAKTAVRKGLADSADGLKLFEMYNSIIESARAIWGERFRLYALANAVILPYEPENGVVSRENAVDHAAPLCARVLSACSHADSPDWWKVQFEGAENDSTRMFACLLLLSCGSPRTMSALSAEIDEVLPRLSSGHWKSFASSLRFSSFVSRHRSEPEEPTVGLRVDELPASLNPRTVAAFAVTTRTKIQTELFLKYLASYEGDDSIVAGLCQQSLILLSGLQPGSWDENLKRIQHLYLRTGGEALGYWGIHGQLHLNMPITGAETVLRDPTRYPVELIDSAQRSCGEELSTKLVPVAVTARSERWFNF